MDVTFILKKDIYIYIFCGLGTEFRDPSRFVFINNVCCLKQLSYFAVCSEGWFIYFPMKRGDFRVAEKCDKKLYLSYST